MTTETGRTEPLPPEAASEHAADEAGPTAEAAEPEGQPAAPTEPIAEPEDQPAAPTESTAEADDEAAQEAPTLPPPEPIAAVLHEPELPPADLVPPPSIGPAPRWLPAPASLEMEPTEGPVLAETRVTLRGDHLYRESIVRFDGLIAMPIGAAPPRELTVRTPLRDKPGAVEVTVQNPGAPLVVIAQAFRYAPLPPPAITGVAPHAGAPKGGTEISVTGQGFVAWSVVLVDGVRSETTFVDAHTLDARTPPGKSGAMVDVGVENPDGKRALAPRAFAYDERYAR